MSLSGQALTRQQRYTKTHKSFLLTLFKQERKKDTCYKKSQSLTLTLEQNLTTDFLNQSGIYQLGNSATAPQNLFSSTAVLSNLEQTGIKLPDSDKLKHTKAPFMSHISSLKLKESTKTKRIISPL